MTKKKWLQNIIFVNRISFFVIFWGGVCLLFFFFFEGVVAGQPNKGNSKLQPISKISYISKKKKKRKKRKAAINQ